MITFVLIQDDRYYASHDPDARNGCGQAVLTDSVDDAAIFRAEIQNGRLVLVSGVLPDGDWTARAVQLFLKV